MPDIINGFVEENEFRNVLLDEPEVLIAAQMRDVVDGAGDEIVEPDDTMTIAQQIVCQVRSEKTRCSGDHRDRLACLCVFAIGCFGAGHTSLRSCITEGEWRRKQKRTGFDIWESVGR